MYRMIVVDDNKMERNGISRMVDWAEHGIEIVGLYMHGQHALEQLERDIPHLILADIQMPVMNGLELAQAVKSKHPDTRILFMSSYDDFHLVKSAVQLGADDYILKPLVQDELLQTIRKAIRKIQAEEVLQRERQRMTEQLNRSLSLYQEQLLRDMLFGLAQDSEENRLKLNMLGMSAEGAVRYQVCALQISYGGGLFQADNVADKFFASYLVKKLVKENHAWMSRYPAVQTSDQEFVVVIAADGKEAIESSIMDAVVRLQEQIRDQLHLPCRIGLSTIGDDVSLLPFLYRQSLAAVRSKFYGKGDPIIRYEEIEDRDALQLDFDIQTLYREVKEYLLSDVPSGDVGMEDIWDKHWQLTALPVSEDRIKAFLITLNNAMQLVHLDVQKTVRNLTLDIVLDLEWGEGIGLDAVKVKVQSVLDAAKTLLHKQHKPHHDHIVDQVKDIIARQYHEQLTVNQIAEAVYMSPSHLNSIYKAKTGQTIFDSLVEYRMEKAMELLKSPSSRIYMTALQVGYTNKSHFCLTFKKYAGVTPSEYKNGLHPKKGE